jgi:hypothetical protein
MFRFTIRELVLLTIIVAMGVGWWVEHRAKGKFIADRNSWIHFACILQLVLEDEGWTVDWDQASDLVEVVDEDELKPYRVHPDGFTGYGVPKLKKDCRRLRGITDTDWPSL